MKRKGVRVEKERDDKKALAPSSPWADFNNILCADMTDFTALVLAHCID